MSLVTVDCTQVEIYVAVKLCRIDGVPVQNFHMCNDANIFPLLIRKIPLRLTYAKSLSLFTIYFDAKFQRPKHKFSFLNNFILITVGLINNFGVDTISIYTFGIHSEYFIHGKINLSHYS